MDRQMNTENYDNAWTELLSARRAGNYTKVREAAGKLEEQARILERQQMSERTPYICNHTFDRNGVCTRCGYNASQTII